MTRFRSFFTGFLTSVAFGAAVCSAAARAEPVGAVEHLPTKCDVEKLVAGPDGNVWFSCFRAAGRPGGAGGGSVVGRMTPDGTLTEFSAGIPAGGAIRDLVAGPDGNLWFTFDPGFSRSGAPSHRHSAIGRITPAGVVTMFSAGLSKKSYPGEIIAGSDGNLWFTESTGSSAVGRVTPQGSITVFPLGLQEALGIGGLGAGPDGNLWFTQVFDLPHGDNEPGGQIGRVSPTGEVTSFGAPPAALGAPIAGPDGNVWFIGAPNGRTAIDRVTPSGEIAEFGKGQVGVPSQLVAGPDGNIWFTAQQSIGRVTPSGQLSTFTDCMDFRQLFSEATSIVSGPGGDLWFSTVTSRQLPSIGEPPTIGRVTPSGEITLFKDGVDSQSSLIAGPDGRVWFAGGREEIGRITPPSSPVNTFIFATGEAKAGGAAQLPVEVPGPGRIELRQLALMLPGKKTNRLPNAPSSQAVADACGPTRLQLKLQGAAKAALRHDGRVQIKVRATFTPTGGSANTAVRTIVLRGRRH
jgi:streptogramin lyase